MLIEVIPSFANLLPSTHFLGIKRMLRVKSNSARAVAPEAQIEGDTVLFRRSSVIVLLALLVVYYLFLLSNGTFRLFAPEVLDKTFNNMLVHLLRGDFTVDPQAIGWEAFTRDGKTYAYWGIFPAVLRLVVMPFTDIENAELARLSCLAAVVIFVALQLRMALMVHHSLPAATRRPEFLAVMLAATALSGPQIYVLYSGSIHHEPILWSATQAAAFNLVIVRTTYGNKALRCRELVLLAALAGLAINTRVTIGLALYLGAFLLVAWTAWHRYALGCAARRFSLNAMELSATILPPIAILALGAVVAGVVNFERWGSAFTFADWRYYGANYGDVLRQYGQIDLRRIWIGALYYSTGVPYVLKSVPPFADFLSARVATIEAPPITPLLTNPLTIILAAIGVYRIWWKTELSGQRLAILRLALIGHAFAVGLILAAMYLALRHRFDFAPFTTLAALIGYGSASMAMTEVRESWRKRIRIAAIGLCLLGIISSHYVLLVSKVWDFGVPTDVRLALFPFAPFAYHTLAR